MATEILRLKEILKEKNISGVKFAGMVGITKASVSTIINGKSFPKPDLLLKIASVLNVDVKELFNSTKTETKTEIEKIYIKKDSEFVVIGELNNEFINL